MASIGGKMLCGRIISKITPRKPPDSMSRLAFHTGWNGGRHGRVPIQTVRRGASSGSEDGIKRVRVDLESGRGMDPLLSRRYCLRNSSEASLHSGSSDSSTAGMVTAGVVSNSDTLGEQGGNTTVTGKNVRTRIRTVKEK